MTAIATPGGCTMRTVAADGKVIGVCGLFTIPGDRFAKPTFHIVPRSVACLLYRLVQRHALADLDIAAMSL